MGEATFQSLQYDADGNATQIQTSTGTWNVEYNGENRPIRWTNAATGTVITMTFDSQGRRTEYKSVTNGTQNTWLRFLYDGYLCIQVLYSNSPYNTFKEFIWDPTEPVATRPLVFRYAPNNLNLFYAFDGNKNVSDVFYRLTSNGIGAHYDYAPFGATTRTHRDSSASFDIVSLNPFRFSSEYYDSELDLIYYNHRHYSPTLGRFLSRDPIQEQGGLNLYAFVGNRLGVNDVYGLLSISGPIVGYSWSVPTPIAGVFFRVTLSVDISGFECCKNGKKIKMLSLAGTLTGEAVTGKAFKGKVRARNSKGSKCRDKKTGRFVKCPENGWTQGIVVGDFIEDPDVCPVPYVGFSASIVGNVTAGAYVAGVTAEFDFPIYPNIEVPSLSFGYSKGTAGFEVSLGVSGELFAVIYENETVNLSI